MKPFVVTVFCDGVPVEKIYAEAEDRFDATAQAREVLPNDPTNRFTFSTEERKPKFWETLIGRVKLIGRMRDWHSDAI